MAQTALSDLNFQSALFKEALGATFTDKLKIYNQLLTQAPDSVISSNDRGQFVSLPTFNVSTDRMTQISTGTTLTPNKLTQRLERAAWLSREIAFSSEQINMVVAAQDPTEEAAIQLGTIIAKEVQAATISALTGVFTTALLSTHVLDDSSNTVSIDQLLAAKLKLGDSMSELAFMLTNSKVYGDMISKKMLVEAGANVNAAESGEVGRVLGMFVGAEDALTAAAGTYKSYLAAPGAVLYKFRTRPDQMYTAKIGARVATPNGIIADFEVDRSALSSGGVDTLIARVSFLVHPVGMRWTDATSNPSDTDLATGSNWTKAATDDKLIKMVQYLSK